MTILEAAPAVGAPYRRRWPLGAALVAGFLCQLGLRLWFARGQTGPMLIPDESGYLLAARFLAGGVAGDLSGQVFYQAGYPLLIAPAYLVGHDPGVVYPLVLAINAFFGAGVCLLGYGVARRMGTGRWQAYTLAQLCGLLPGLVYYGQFAVTDAVLPVLVLGWALLAHAWLRSGRMLPGVLAAGLAAYASCVHVRGDVFVVVQVGLLCAAAVRRRFPVWAAATLVIGCALGWLLNTVVRMRLYPAGTSPLGERLIHRLTTLDGLGWTLSLAVGKLWYLCVSTWGLAGAGLVALAAVAVSRRYDFADRALAVALLAATGGIAVASSAAVADEGTVANLAYGRYLTCVVPVLFLAGGVMVLRAHPVRAVQGVLGASALAVAAALVVVLHAGDRLHTSFFGPFDFPEPCFLSWDWTALHPWTVTAVALAILMAVVLAVVAYGRWVLVVTSVAIAATSVMAIAVTTDKVSRYWIRSLTPRVSLAAAGLRSSDRVAMSYVGMPWRVWTWQATQVPSGLVPFDRWSAGPLPAGVTLVVVPWDVRTSPFATWPGVRAGWHLTAAVPGATVSWTAWRHW